MLESIFGLPVKYETWNKKNTMPLYIAGGYDFRTAYIADKRCIMIKPTEELAALPALKKKTLPFTAMTLSRAVKQLEFTDLFFITKDGVNKVIESKYKRGTLFEKAGKYLSTPVRRAGYIDKPLVASDMIYAGETALAEKTMLNLELWAYDPKMFSHDNTADALSVALSLKDHADERIEEAVEELIEKELKDYEE